MRTCDIDQCDRKHVAKGMCSMHYNQVSTNHHRKTTMKCDACGDDFQREDRSNRYTGVYCSWACRSPEQYAEQRAAKAEMPARPKRQYGPAKPKTKAKRTVECVWCGSEYLSCLKDAKYCTPRCKHKASEVRRRGREHNAPGVYSWAQVVKLWISFDKCCAYCATPTDMHDIQAEHVEAISVGGANNISNLLPSCGMCNSDKRELTLTAWTIDRARRGLPTRITTWHAADKRYMHLTSRV